MLLTVERVAHLRHVALFSATPDHVLAGVATAVDEVEFAAGDTLMRAGDIEDWLFVVVSGRVDVVRPDRRVSLGPGAVVGELAVLDPQPRSATVTATTPVTAFRLSKPAFDEAVRTRPEVALGVITELVRRLRETHEARPDR
ncbi:Crp/Fnr family transcriptional regulator [Knoellia sinensis KCTC 19936]|uniref:Crp/Fnr family transcriptional regulator n=1 Tax=Knoellia sinensis KCTC 19936 TaxID=1385520 RepID=A0A0A0JF22_9MICO|nr:cyclic nucleotide-binding domain-containing protein [Knoellia sinensis]KGN34642.1 Crp/Fnr family transcriptional regulator [Knoellia sinensis KCTC 19936]